MENQDQVVKMPVIGDQAPDFTAVTTKGTIKFSDYAKDKWVVLFSHPADFTPVCTTEMTDFAQRKAEFDALNTELMGLSIDSIHAHLAWVNNVREKTGVYFDFGINSYIIDAIIGLSVVYKALDNMGAYQRWFGFQPDTKAATLIFGFFHGFGLASKIIDYEISPDGLLPNLLAFNVGVEIGQRIGNSTQSRKAAAHQGTDHRRASYIAPACPQPGERTYRVNCFCIPRMP